MKIAIVVHGRFHAFNLARALLDQGDDVTVLTNYPKWAVKRFDVAPQHVRSLWPQGVISRALWGLHELIGTPFPEASMDTWFARWAAGQLERDRWDAIHCWSGVAEESLLRSRNRESLNAMMRGSAHILTQARLLKEEEIRTGVRLDRPSDWVIARELREYQLCDIIVVLSTFAYNSFVAQGIPRSKLHLLPLGVNVASFRPSPEILEERCRRIRSGQRLRVLYVGAISYQKGMWDMEKIIRMAASQEFEFRFVGPVTPECKPLVERLRGSAEFIPKQPQSELGEWYAWGDVFIFPTIQDGFAVVLAQAQAGALPILTTTNSGGPDIIEEGETGWTFPLRSPQAFIDQLHWCDSHREELAEMVRYSHAHFRSRTWTDVAKGFVEMIQTRRDERLSLRLGHRGLGSE